MIPSQQEKKDIISALEGICYNITFNQAEKLTRAEVKDIISALKKLRGGKIMSYNTGICDNVYRLLKAAKRKHYYWWFLFAEYPFKGKNPIYPFAEIDELNGYNQWEGKSLEARIKCLDWLIKRFKEELK